MAMPRAESVNLRLNQKTTTSRRTYVQMVLRQHTPPNLERLLSHHKSFLVPPKSRVRGSEIVYRIACSRERQPKPSPQPKDHNITSHLCPDGSPAAHAAETQASSLASQELLGAAQVQSTRWRHCALHCLEQRASTSASTKQKQITSHLCEGGSPAARAA